MICIRHRLWKSRNVIASFPNDAGMWGEYRSADVHQMQRWTVNTHIAMSRGLKPINTKLFAVVSYTILQNRRQTFNTKDESQTLKQTARTPFERSISKTNIQNKINELLVRLQGLPSITNGCLSDPTSLCAKKHITTSSIAKLRDRSRWSLAKPVH